MILVKSEILVLFCIFSREGQNVLILREQWADQYSAVPMV